MSNQIVELPFRIDPDGRLARVGRASGLVELFRAMAATPAAAWKHAPWFGLEEVFLEADMRLEDQQGVADVLNHALKELGVSWATVVSVRRPETADAGERTFAITLDVRDDATHHGVVKL